MSTSISLFPNQPAEQARYDHLKAKLLDQTHPEGELELLAFDRFLFASYLAERTRRMELDCIDRWQNEPQNQTWFLQLERLQKMAASNERRADRALNELRKLQRDRILSPEVASELFLLNEANPVPIPASLPLAEMRRSNFSRTSPATLALSLLAASAGHSQHNSYSDQEPQRMNLRNP